MNELANSEKQSAVGAVKELLPEVNRLVREPIPVSEIILGTNCGGSDGNSHGSCCGKPRDNGDDGHRDNSSGDNGSVK